MKGVQFLVDAKGQTTAIVIDLKRNPEVWEDLFDRALARRRRDEPREPLESVTKRLRPRGKRRAGA
jgi:hypothetical protein